MVTEPFSVLCSMQPDKDKMGKGTVMVKKLVMDFINFENSKSESPTFIGNS